MRSCWDFVPPRFGVSEFSPGLFLETTGLHGVEIYYEVHGSGTPLPFTHGYSSTSAKWQGQVEVVSKQYKLITWDMRGHGTTRTTGQLGANHTPLSFKKSAARDGWNEYARNTYDDFDRNGLGSLQNMSPERSQVSHRNAKGIAHAARGTLAQRDPNVISSSDKIKVPSMVLVGEDDKRFLVVNDHMASKIPGAKKVVIPKAGYPANIDKPKAVNEELMAFLSGLEGRLKASM